jgi:acetylornithine/N-succinyldiaminopimelate aminotransferase
MTTGTVELYKKYVLPTYPPSDLTLVKGSGANVWDAEGRKFLDFAVGISVSNLGHCHKAVVKAIRAQAGKLIHTSNLYLNEVQPKLAELIAKNSFDGLSFFCNSGAEANEGMIKLVRKWGSSQGKFEIVAMEDSFHGRTLATLAATGRSKYRKGFEPDMPGFVHVPFNDLEAARKAIGPKTAAILVEPVQGEGGVRPSAPGFLEGLRKLCDEKGILLLFDEVQCGMGRTGKLFAWQGYGVEPDAFTLAKAVANGIPMGVLVVKRKYSDVLTPGTHASTFGGTPLACAAALAVFDTMLNGGVLENCKRQSSFLMDSINKLKAKHKCIVEVRGRGLLIGVQLDRPVVPLLPLLRKQGLIALVAGETVLRLLPPLIVSEAQCKSAVRMIDKALSEFEAV